MPNAIDPTVVLSFFTGKPHEKAVAALDLLQRSLDQGFWIKGASRSVRAALTKTNVAEKFARKVEADVGDRGGFGYEQDGYEQDGLGDAFWWARHVLHFGLIDGLLSKEVEPAIFKKLAGHDCDAFLDFFRRYMVAMKPVAEALAHLDSCRPKPAFTYMAASPTITATMEKLGASKVGVCPHHWENYDHVDPKTKKITHVVAMVLDWPSATVFGAGPFGYGRLKCQCESCGHGIKNPFNWVPLLLTTKPVGTPAALWVGRDCAETLFGVKLEGELEIAK